jgi:putative tryptophan/tyrosine transport system substrate-binding protein
MQRSSLAPIVAVAIIFWTGADPIAAGLVESLSHPGGTLTGASVLNFAVIGKRLEVLHELVPGVHLIAHLTNPNNRAFAEAETQELQVGPSTCFETASSERN